ncbi:SMC family ATPase [Nocardioides salsibiostraticola]
MRLHHLEVTAFGPFSDTVRVDFDQLSQAGLFLLSGATGSGKTSVLDAVTFALYGAVPGDRNAAKRLRSDHAEPGARPEVALETTLAGRRFRITRSPSWDRPKKRGTGLTSEPPAVSLSESVDGTWRHLSSRADETGQIIGDLVGMNLTQFTQVALLPQGQFQAFLRATSEERHQLLQRLFRTGRFERVEAWLREHRLQLRRETTQAHHELAEVISRVSEVVDEPVPEDWDLGDLTEPATSGSLLTWLSAHRSEVDERLDGARNTHELAALAEDQAQAALQEAELIRGRRVRLVEASAERTALQAQSVDHLWRRERLELARRAAGLADVLDIAADRQQRYTPTRAHARASVLLAVESGLELTAQSPMTAPPPEQAGMRGQDGQDGQLLFEWDDPGTSASPKPFDPATLDESAPAVAQALQTAVDKASDRCVRLRHLLPKAARLDAASAEVRQVESRREMAVGHEADLSDRSTRITGVLSEIDAALLVARENSSRRPDLMSRVAQSIERLSAHAEVRDLMARLEAARERHHVIEQRAQDLRETWLFLKEARLESMAAEIAGQLAVGDCCPVCGSADHPDKALRDTRAPDATQEKQAFTQMEDAKAEAHARDGAVRDLVTGLAVAQQRAGTDSEADTRTQHATLERECSVADAAGREVTLLEGRRATQERELDLVATAVSHRQDEAREATSAIRVLEAEIRSIEGDLTEALLATGETDLAQALSRSDHQVEAGRTAQEALQAAEVARLALDEANARLSTSLQRAGFDTTENARAALLPEAEVRELDEAVRLHEDQLAAVRRILAEPGAQQEAAQPLPDLEALTQTCTQRRASASTAREQVVLLTSRSERLADLTRAYAQADLTWRPRHDQLVLANALGAFVEGKSADNRWHMRLSAYVLAYRLSQVVDAANERLSGMSDQRYSLVHTGQRGAGEKRGGLSLLVRDDWSGESRDPATLSGGETFVVSLALALGLADVISGEAGGMRLDTLFVDEGFGSLDAETLDGVMDTLDSLRDGGRVVGVVSHVAEMRDRIPTQLVVTKTRSGSTLAIRG